AFIAALVFAVHPVHTEVVASIKNRDELLAFVFMLLAARHVHLFIKTKRLPAWLLALLFFSLGMLSKKSIYPMVFILPLVPVFFNPVALQRILTAFLSCIIPAAVIGADFAVSRGLVLLIAPLAVICSYYLFKQHQPIRLKLSAFFSLKYTSLIWWAISWAILFFAFFHSQIGYLLLAAPFLFLALYRGTQNQVFIAVLQLAVAAFLFKSGTLSISALTVAVGYGWYAHSKNELSYKHILLASALMLVHLVSHFSFGAVALVLNINVFFFLLYKRAVWAILFIAASIVLSFLVFKPEPYLAALLILSVGFYFFKDNKIFMERLAICLVIASLFHVSFKSQSVAQLWNIHFAPNEVAVVDETIKQKNSSLTEGRPLHYIENPLVAAHSKSELAGTGFLTLAEYMRLMVFPVRLSFYYGYARMETTSLNALSAWLSMLLHLGLIALALWQLNKRPLLSIGIAWYLLSILLFSNWVELVAGMVGERLAFGASAGFCLMVAVLVVWLKPGFNFTKPKAVEYAFMIVLVLFAARTIARNNDWKDALTLMQHDIEHLDRSAYAHHTLGTNLMYVSTTNTRLSNAEAGNMQLQAIHHFNRSIEVYPYFFNAHFDLARVYIANADYPHAKEALSGAYQLDSNNLFVLEELAKTSFELKEVQQTAYYANRLLAKEPMNENVHEILAYSMLVNDRKPEAKKYAQRGLRYFPENKNLNMMLKDAEK
ncbi:MAG: tetratricopeptide repeat protein, partial [Bacteroidota bacterium]